ncbi:metal ion ABC transporter substrate-binding periplasmic protein [Acetobacter estunensis NRIC 0472]|uniref:Metal ABC transporter substrate-binding protein n=1 Tax=Acetobacter estunensis TaxID=104097 RepID=A0A967BAE8_9PROT|nr:zinc ABC transporter substrate-binding protein [Acetobacter estunensis]NHO55106.1 metal ABC transporter substrate-binding protein [Acetobacter estunensis]GBQ22478.1 metal ion ABC transporter substrate-binding periplasmic protein [Acetobacter estunensis NRIC 0472]
MFLSRRTVLAFLGALALPVAAQAASQPLPVVAAESVWGDIAASVGGPHVSVTSIIHTPDIDPHMFEASPSVARAIAGAGMVVVNGAGYDSWMDRLVAASGHTPPVVSAAQAAGWKDGDNPHLWFDPAVVRATAERMADVLRQAQPQDAMEIKAYLATFEQELGKIDARIAALKVKVGGLHVGATEPLPGRLTDALGMVSDEKAFQLAVMNEAEPAPEDVARFERDLKDKHLNLLIYNEQTTTPTATRLVEIARKAGVPVMGLSETLPEGLHWFGWMNRTLDQIEALLVPAAKAR